MATLQDKNVMVTGGAGFIGSHLCDAIIKESVAKLLFGIKKKLFRISKYFYELFSTVYIVHINT